MLTFDIRSVFWVFTYPQIVLGAARFTAKQVTHLLIVDLHIAVGGTKHGHRSNVMKYSQMTKIQSSPRPGAGMLCCQL